MTNFVHLLTIIREDASLANFYLVVDGVPITGDTFGRYDLGTRAVVATPPPFHRDIITRTWGAR